MRIFVTSVLMVFAGAMCFLYVQEVSLNEITKKQITELTLRVSALETQQQNVKVLKSDIRTLDVKIDTLREALTSAADPPVTSLPTGTSSIPPQP